jgi:acyl-CoA synthetase (NDP forming)
VTVPARDPGQTDTGRLGVAVVGASPRNFWTLCAIRNLLAFGQERVEVWPVTPNHQTVMGLPAYPTVAALPAAPAAAVVAVRRESCPAVVRDLGQAGARDIVIVSDGFAERGDEAGAALEAELVRESRRAGIRLIGPNCVGFADFSAGLCAIAEPIPFGIRAGDVSFVTQSGALLSSTLSGFVEEGLGADWCASIGNGAVVGVAEALRLAAERPTTRVIAAYMEGLPGPEAVPAFQSALTEARDQGKTVVILKSGTSDRGRRAVLSHTASIAGTDAAFTSLLDSLGAIRVSSMDDLIRTATVARLGAKPGRARQVAIVGSSGGVAALSSDLATSRGVDLAVFSEETITVLKQASGPGSFIENPFDIVGKPSADGIGKDAVYEAVFADPNVGFVLAPFSVNFPDDVPERETHRVTFQMLARLAAKYQVPTLITSIPVTEWSPWVREFQSANKGVPVVRGLAQCFAALAHLFPGAGSRGQAPAGPAHPGSSSALSEEDSRSLLRDAGIPVVAGRAAPTADGAAAAARELRPPYAVKVLASVGHKMALGGVRLGCTSEADVSAAAEGIREAVLRNGLAAEQLEGFLVEEMVFGQEILVGLNTDALFGKYLVVGLGGVNAELADVATTRLLPVTSADVTSMLARIGLASNQPAHDFITAIATSFTDGALAVHETVEVNPAIVTRTECLAADAVVYLASPSSPVPAAAAAAPAGSEINR